MISAVVYGGLFALFVSNYYEKIGEMRKQLEGNPFAGLAEAMIGLEWGCPVIALSVITVLCSAAIARVKAGENIMTNHPRTTQKTADIAA